MKNKEKEVKKRKPKNPFFAVIAVLVASVVLFGAVLGIIRAVREAGSVMIYENIFVGDGVARCIISSYKPGYIKQLTQSYGGDYEVEDTAEFWNVPHPEEDGATFGEVFCRDAEEYLQSQIIGAYLFDYATNDGSSSSRQLKARVDEFVEEGAREVLDFKADSDEGKFNEKAKPMGFTYSDFVEASKLMYKCSFARVALFGEEGDALRDNAYYADATDFYTDTYTRVKILLIRTESDVIRDNEGELLKDEGGNYVYSELNERERAARRETVEQIREAIVAYETGGNNQISEAYFDNKIEQFNSYYDYKEGYYFSERSEATSGFAEEVSEEVARLALSLTSDAPYGEVEVDGLGVYFLCRCELEADGFVNVENENFFTDFYSDFADFRYLEIVSASAQKIKIKDSYYAIDAQSLPMNIDFIIRE